MSINLSADSAREALRREHGVRLVTSAEEGFAASDLPEGVYGFTSSPALAAPLFATKRCRNFEVHRLPNGPAVIGFVTPAEAAQLRSSEEPVTLRLHPDAQDDATVIVSIPYERIVQHRQYSVRNADAVTLQVRPLRVSALSA